MVLYNGYLQWNYINGYWNRFSKKYRVSRLCKCIRKQIDQLDAFVLDPNALSINSNKFDDFQLNLELLKDKCRSLVDAAQSALNEPLEIKSALESSHNILKLLKKVSEASNNSTAELKVKSVFSSFIAESKQIKKDLDKIESAVRIDYSVLIKNKMVVSVFVAIVLGIFVLPYAVVNSYKLSGAAVNSPALIDPYNILVEYTQRCKPNYLHQNRDFWPTILSGFTDLHDKTGSSTYLLLYNEAPYDTVKCVADVISNMAEQWWNATSVYGSRKSETIDGIRGLSFGQRKSLVGYVKERKINELWVTNIEHFPIEIVKDFHFICDSSNPTIKPSIAIFLLKTDQHLSQKNNVYAIAEKTLQKLWSNHIDNDVLAPLLTRLVSYPIFVNPESSFSSCC